MDISNQTVDVISIILHEYSGGLTARTAGLGSPRFAHMPEQREAYKSDAKSICHTFSFTPEQQGVLKNVCRTSASG